MSEKIIWIPSSINGLCYSLKAHNRKNGQKVWHYLLMLTIYTTHDSAIPPVHISPKGRCMCARVHYVCVYTHVFMHKNVHRSPRCSELQLEATQMLVPISSRTKYVNCVINHNWTWNSDKEWSTVAYNTGESHKWNVNDRSQTQKHIRTVWLHLREVQKQAKLARATRVASHEASDWQGAEEAHRMLESFFLERGGSVQVTEAHQVHTYGAYTFCIYDLL